MSLDRALAALSELADDAHAVAQHTGAPWARHKAEAFAVAFEAVADIQRRHEECDPAQAVLDNEAEQGDGY